MGSSLTHLNTVVLGAPGDHTAGIMYDSWTHPKSPIPGFSAYTNYPFGDNLKSPTSVTSTVLSLGHWVLSYFGTVATGWNLLVLIGYMSSALLMFGFIYWLTQNVWAAFFAGYAIAFTPYHVFASRGQIAGLYGAIFIAIIWLFMYLRQKHSLILSALLGVLFGIGFYLDGYFILIGLCLLLSFWIATILNCIISKNQSKDNLRQYFFPLTFTSAISFLFLMPLFWINATYASRINAVLGNARGNIEINALTYSAKLPMYLDPKSILYLGASVFSLAIIGLFVKYRKTKKVLHKIPVDTKKIDLALRVSIIIFLIAVWVSLQPTFHLGPFTLYNPSKLIISITQAWRVFGRLYMLVSIAIVTLAAIGMHLLQRKYPSKTLLIFSVSLLLLILEFSIYSTSHKTDNFSYSNVPAIYKTLKNDTSIKAIAEYPLNDPTYNADYFTYQTISKLPIYNSFTPGGSSKPVNQSIVGINDPQTLPVLRALGINAVNIRPVVQGSQTLDISKVAFENKGLQPLFSGRGSKNEEINSFRIKPGTIANYALTIPDDTFLRILLTKSGKTNYTLLNDINLAVVTLPTLKNSHKKVSISFNIESENKRNASLLQNGKALWTGEISALKQQISIQADPQQIMTLYLEKNSIPINVTLSEPQALATP